MPNGRGQLECSYCTHYGSQGHPSACRRYQVRLPLPEAGMHRICRGFSVSERAIASGHASCLAKQFSELQHSLRPGHLYVFPYPSSDRARDMAASTALESLEAI